MHQAHAKRRIFFLICIDRDFTVEDSLGGATGPGPKAGAPNAPGAPKAPKSPGAPKAPKAPGAGGMAARALISSGVGMKDWIMAGEGMKDPAEGEAVRMSL